MESALQRRIQWVDFVKGIAIILVIIGHTVNNYVVRSFIFSFHMPLFFVLSGYTFRPSSDKEVIIQIKKSIKRLIVPAYAIWLIRSILYYFINGKRYSVIQYLFSAIYASGTDTSIKGIDIPAFGMMWFLIVLFFCRLFFDVIHMYIKKDALVGSVVILLCMIGIIIGYKRYLPFSLDLAFVSVTFFYAGYLFHNKVNLADLCRHKRIISSLIAFAIWGGVFVVALIEHQHLELASRDYPFFLLSIIMALSGCYFIMNLSIVFCKCNIFQRISRGVTIVGKKSMLLFTIHAFDAVWYPFLLIKVDNIAAVLLVRLCIDLMVMMLIIKISAYKQKRISG